MQLAEGLEVLASRGWLAEVGRETAARLFPLARWRRFGPGDILTLGGEERDDLIGLARGTVAFTSALGLPETPVMHMAQAVFWMGYGPTLRGRERVIMAEARTEVWAASFPGGRIRSMLDAGTLDWRPFMALMAEYGDISAVIAADLLIRDSKARCAAVLARFAGLRSPLPGSDPVTVVPVTQGELAAACNLSRNATAALLRGWAAEGIVEIGYAAIRIGDPAALVRLAGGGAAAPRPL
jgi:CRP-like cAMP-binding protein